MSEETRRYASEDKQIPKIEDKVIPNVTKNINVDADSIELGSPTKGGKIKIYFDSTDVVTAKKKIDNAKEVLNYANANISINV